MSCAEFFGETSNHPGDSVPLQPRFGALWPLAFPKTIIPLKGKRFQTADEVQENTMRKLMVTGRTVRGTPQGVYFKGEWCVIVLCTKFLVSSSVNVSIFHITGLATFWIGLIGSKNPEAVFLLPQSHSLLLTVLLSVIHVATNTPQNCGLGPRVLYLPTWDLTIDA